MPTPMMWAVGRYAVTSTSNTLCVLECSLVDLANWCEHFWIADRNAAKEYANICDDPASADLLAIDVLKAERWNDVLDGKSLRSAELLCWPLVPPVAIGSIHVPDERSRRIVFERLAGRSLSIPVCVTPRYFPY
jgi:hypothetical protein